MTTLGVLLRQRRTLAKLSRARLARLAGLCEATIKFIEFDKHNPTRQTRLKLLAISDLSLSTDELGLNPQALPLPKRASGAGADPFARMERCRPVLRGLLQVQSARQGAIHHCCGQSKARSLRSSLRDL